MEENSDYVVSYETYDFIYMEKPNYGFTVKLDTTTTKQNFAMSVKNKPRDINPEQANVISSQLFHLDGLGKDLAA